MGTPSKKILVKFEKVKKNAGYNDYYLLATEGELPGAFKVKKVAVLPETGEEGILYLVPKVGTEGDIYDEYLWALNEYDEYGWERVGSTAITLDVDDELSLTSENPVQNKVITAAIGNVEAQLHAINNGEES